MNTTNTAVATHGSGPVKDPMYGACGSDYYRERASGTADLLAYVLGVAY